MTHKVREKTPLSPPRIEPESTIVIPEIIPVHYTGRAGLNGTIPESIGDLGKLTEMFVYIFFLFK